MASGFVSLDNVSPPDPTLPATSIQLALGLVMVGEDVTDGRDDTQIFVTIDAGDTAFDVNNKIAAAVNLEASNRGLTVPARQLVLPQFTKG